MEKTKTMKVIVAHPGQQHSYQLAMALKKQGCLFRYVTTYYSFQSRKGIIASLLGKINTRAAKRRCEGLEDPEVKTFLTYGFYLVAFLLRADKSGKLYRKADEWLSNWFGKIIARYAIKNNADAVIMYDTNAERCFSILKKKAPNIIRIQDVSAINRLYMKDVYEKDMKRSPECAQQLMKERGFLFDEKSQASWKNEIALSEYFIVPSEIVRTSLLYSGVKPAQIFDCPYGTYFEIQKSEYSKHEKLKVLYVGNVTQMKGIFYLLEAAKKLPKEKFEFTVVGKYGEKSEILEKYRKYVHFTGFVMHERVKDYLEQADVFVFPSLGDSFGLAVLEALSYGVPVICSDHAGAADAIADGKNGFIVPVGSSEAIIEKLQYCYNNPEFMKRAKQAAYETAEKYSWSNYQDCIGNMVEKIRQFKEFHMDDGK